MFIRRLHSLRVKLRFWRHHPLLALWSGEKRLWLMLCLVALQGVLSFSDWRDTLQVLRNQAASNHLHAEYERSEQAFKAAKKDDKTTAIRIEALRQVTARAKLLRDADHAMQKTKLVSEALSLGVMASVLILGLWATWESRREAERRKLAEGKLQAEHSSLEWRIEVRTAELKAQVDERSRAEEMIRHQKRVLELLANNASLEMIFTELTQYVAERRRSWEAAVHLADEAEMLRCVASSRTSALMEHYFKELSVSSADAPETRSYATGTSCMIEMLSEEHRPWSEFLVSNGLCSIWSLPIMMSDRRVAGTLTIYSRRKQIPSVQDQDFLSSATRLANLVVTVRQMNQEMARKAYEDDLTGVANRRGGELRLQKAIKHSDLSGEPFAVLLIDLDRFKHLNDLYGHGIGDQVLSMASQRISTHPRVQGSMARMGGDEFLVILEACISEQDAMQTASELAAQISQPMDLGQATTTVGASIGITLYPRDGVTTDELERHADAAMYKAKREGLGCCAFTSAIYNHVELAISIEGGLSEALLGDPQRNLLEVQYQPIYRSYGDLLGFEALLRFRHPQLGSISPAQFIPIAEESKLIIPLGRWVLEQVCRQSRAWDLAGHPSVRFGVNTSAIQWGREDFVDEVRKLLDETGVPASALTMELTESVVMENAALVETHMQELKKLGIRLSMDDFGTGYSSLSYLHQLPLDALKIDKSFVARLEQADDSRTIVESIISMAHVLGMITVAEGVETEAQERMLIDMGCDALQGYLFAHPMPAQVAVAYICNRHDLPLARTSETPRMPRSITNESVTMQMDRVSSSAGHGLPAEAETSKISAA